MSMVRQNACSTFCDPDASTDSEEEEDAKLLVFHHSSPKFTPITPPGSPKYAPTSPPPSKVARWGDWRQKEEEEEN